jgi:predicted ATP-dependent endonuclease of OLD family
VKDETLHCENLTALLGANGSGKSSFLRALEVFYEPSAHYGKEDFYAEDTLQPIVMTVTFANLTPEEKKLFQLYVEGEELTVEKEMTWPLDRGSQKYYGTSLKNPEFQAFYDAKGGDMRGKYNELHAKQEYGGLPAYTNRGDAEKALAEWEQAHPELCERKRDGGQFFGFREVGEAHLERHTRFILVHAVRDASEDVLEKKGSIITEIMDLVVRSVLAQRKEIAEFETQVNERYREVYNPSKIPELQTLEKTLSGLLQTYAPDTGVKLRWKEDVRLEIPMPTADVKIIEDEYGSPVGHTGHGVQRAFILAMLQFLALTETPAEPETEGAEKQVVLKMPNLILGIEEPELYQHPDRQRHLSKVLAKLAQEGVQGVVEEMQVIFSTHSPLFVDLEQFEKIRVFKKTKEDENLPKQTKISYTTLAAVAEMLEKINNRPKGSYTGETLRARLRALLSPWVNEGFFARLVVLVEGIKDRAAVLGAATVMGHDLESQGVAVIPCNSKSSLDRAITVFSSLGIPTYAVWDSDHPKTDGVSVNRCLLRLFNETEEDWPEKISDRFACFKQNLKQKVTDEMGDCFGNALQTCCNNFEIDKSEYGEENPAVYQYIFEEAKKQEKSSPTMEKIIAQIVSLIPS